MTTKLACAVRAGRAAANWTQSEFAAKLFISRITLLRTEAGYSTPREKLLEKIIEVFREAGIYFDLTDDVVITVKHKEHQ